MKRVLSIALLFIYVSLFGGFKLSLHFCGDNLTEYSIYSSNIQDESCCSHHDVGCSQHEVHHSVCCEDKSLFLYSDVNTTIGSYNLTLTAPIFQTQEMLLSEDVSADEVVSFNPNAPPQLLQGRAIYQINSSFTFYG